MKTDLILICLMASLMQAQISAPTNVEYVVTTAEKPCLAPSGETVFRKLDQARAELQQKGRLPQTRFGQTQPHPMFLWPVEKSASAPYHHVWGISNYIDHNIAFPNQVQDWNCGTKTYDTAGGYNHAGIDIFLWPFSWHQFQNDHARVIAAAPGIILYKEDGHFDMSCTMGGGDWNAVYIQHSDGSMAWYGHLKSGSLTTKEPGDSVTAGEFLGYVGSSGNSTGPHLHFEVYNNANQLVDPYTGPCNAWPSATESWWAEQPAYIQQKINSVSTHSAPAVFPACPQTEILNLKDSFLSTETVYAMLFMTDQTIGAGVSITLKRPNGTTAFTNTFTPNVAYNASYVYWSLGPATFNAYGTWTLSFSHNGDVVEHAFIYGSELGLADGVRPEPLRLYPNPASDTVQFSAAIASLEVYQVDGKRLQVPYTTTSADVSTLPKGVFVLRGMDADGQPFVTKMTK